MAIQPVWEIRAPASPWSIVDTNGYRVVGPSRVVFIHPGSDAFDATAVLEVQLPVQPEQRLAPLEGVLAPDQLVRVTERARQVLATVTASAAPVRSITTLDLLGAIAHISHSLGNAILTALGVTEEMVRTASGVEMTREGLPMTEASARVWKAAAAAVQAWQHDYLGTEHLLLGIVAEPANDAATVLARRGVSPALVQEHIAAMLRRNRPA